MFKISKNSATFIVLVVTVVAVSALKIVLASTSNERDQQGRRVKGAKRAAVEIVEFTDFQCPACARSVEFTADVIKNNPETVSIEHKHFPLAMHTHSFRASIFAQCANEQHKFWPYYYSLFQLQLRWEKSASSDSYFRELAMSQGMDLKKLDSCVQNAATVDRVREDIEEGRKLGVSATPTFFVNGQMAVGKENLAKLLAKQGLKL